MEWVHGYSSREVRGGVRYTKEGLIVYPSGCMSIIYDKDTGTQQYVRVHYDQISCLDLHIDLGIAVSSHKGSVNIKVCIWVVSTTRGLGLDMNLPAGAILNTIDCGDVNGVSAVNFSKCGKYVALSCQNSGHNVRIYDWKSSLLLSEVTGGPNKIFGLVFSKYENNNNNLRLLYGGIKHFNFITLRPDRLYNTNIGIYDNILSKRYTKKVNKKTKKNDVNCVISLPMSNNNFFGTDDYVHENEFILGLSDGTLAVIRQGENFVFKYIYVQKVEEEDDEDEDDEDTIETDTYYDEEEDSEEEEIEEFDDDYGSITALCTMNINKEGSPLKYYIITAGTYGHIKILSSSFNFLAEFNIYEKIYGEISLHPLGKIRGIRSISVNKKRGSILYGTSCGEIGEIELEDGNHIFSSSSKLPLVTSHFKSELHALSCHISRQECLTAGDDKTLRIWDLETNTLKRMLFLPDVARAIAYHKSGLGVEVIIIGE
jgi:WD40 repeat protein